VEPAATALRAVMLAGDLTGRSLLVVGGGPIGQLCCRLARHFGAGRVWLSEPSAERRSYAEASQVDRAFDPSGETAELEGLKADAVVECSGVLVGEAIARTAPGGAACLVGIGAAHGAGTANLGELNLDLVTQNKLVMGTINSNRSHFEAAHQALRQVDRRWLEGLLTDRLPLTDWRSAFDTSPERIKAVIEFDA